MESFLNECRLRGLDTSKVNHLANGSYPQGVLPINWGSVAVEALRAFITILETVVVSPTPTPAPTPPVAK